MAKAPSDELERLLWEKQRELMMIRRRVHLLEEFHADLHEVTRGKPFRIWNDLIWMMVLDTRDTVLVQVADWGKAQLVKGGLVGQLRAHHCKAFVRKRSTGDRDLLRDHEAAFDRLFPNAGARPKQEDFDDVATLMKAAIQHAQNDRNRNRAHRYESDVKGEAEVKMLSVDEVRDVFVELERILNDLRGVAGHAVVATDTVMAHVAPGVVAEQLVDAIVLNAPLTALTADRAATYTRLHAGHDASGAGGYFNEDVNS